MPHDSHAHRREWRQAADAIPDCIAGIDLKTYAEIQET